MSNQIKENKMYTGYIELLDNPHELCQWAKEDIEKCYHDSCKVAMKNLVEEKQRYMKKIETADRLARDLMGAYSTGDKEIVADVLEEIKREVR